MRGCSFPLQPCPAVTWPSIPNCRYLTNANEPKQRPRYIVPVSRVVDEWTLTRRVRKLSVNQATYSLVMQRRSVSTSSGDENEEQEQHEVCVAKDHGRVFFMFAISQVYYSAFLRTIHRMVFGESLYKYQVQLSLSFFFFFLWVNVLSRARIKKSFERETTGTTHTLYAILTRSFDNRRARFRSLFEQWYWLGRFFVVEQRSTMLMTCTHS